MVSKLAQLLLCIALGAAAVVLSADVVAQMAQPGAERPSGAPGSAAIGRGRQLLSAADSAQLFDRLDRNRDGHLSAAELASWDGDWIAMDSNRDGRISRSEFRALR